MLQILGCLGVGSKGANEIMSLIIPQGSRNKTIHPVFIFKTVTKTKSSPFLSLCPPGSPSFGSNPHGFWIKKGRSRVFQQWTHGLWSRMYIHDQTLLMWGVWTCLSTKTATWIYLIVSRTLVARRHFFFCIVGSLRIGMASGILPVCFLSFFLFF